MFFYIIQKKNKKKKKKKKKKKNKNKNTMFKTQSPTPARQNLPGSGGSTLTPALEREVVRSL